MTAIIIQLLIGGILLGGLYALIAFGLSLIYGVARVLNFAHGTLLAIAGIAASMMFAAWSISPALIAVVLFPVFFGFGWLMYHTLLEPLKHRNPIVWQSRQTSTSAASAPRNGSPAPKALTSTLFYNASRSLERAPNIESGLESSFSCNP